MGKSRNIVQTTNEDLIDEGILSQIKLNYIRLEESIISQLGMANKKHHVTTGTFREDIWRSLFEQIIPRKFSIEQSVFIMDSQKRVSKEVDLAIFDEMYTPYIFGTAVLNISRLKRWPSLFSAKVRMLRIKRKRKH
ncbi:DUF6602 domain-containing protein [Paenibacillus cisolokensis]|nr:DUF6602 domain-containing protein [Paenibacillus cisolokensis]